ncbi:MAG: helix-turn-helix domain-containing protein [Verrucomicrobiota bacterium]
MSIDGLGRQFQQARNARGLTLDEAARLTKIRQSRLAEIEADDFSNFPSLAYAKGFLQIYGKFLNVDVAPYLEAFETSGHLTIDGYSYLQDHPVAKPARTSTAPRQTSSSRTSLTPLIVGVIVLVGGLWFVRLMLNVQRIAPKPANAAVTAISPSSQSPTLLPMAAPTAAPIRRALPVDSSATTVSIPSPTATADQRISIFSSQGTPATNRETPIPGERLTAATPPSVTPSPTEPEIRRAQPVSAAELAALRGSATPGSVNRIDILPLRKTYVQVTVDDDPRQPAFERWISPADGAVQFRGRHVRVRVLDRGAVQILKNGRIVAQSDADLRID